MSAQIHIVSAQDPAKHLCISADPSLLPGLAPNSVRAKPKIFSITRNSLTYAEYGPVFHWTEAFPVPPFVTAPYNDNAQWVTIPTWGYAEVMESNVSGISPGALLWGFWPASSLPTDLMLEKSFASGFYTEISPHREKLVIKLNNEYELVDKIPSLERMGWVAGTRPFADTGFAMNNLCFPPDEAAKPFNPSGQGEWTKEDADLRKTVVINLMASSRSGLACAWYMRRRPVGHGPLGLVEVCSTPSALPDINKSNFDSLRVFYDDLGSESTIQWIEKLNPERVIICDFGAPSDVSKLLYTNILDNPKLKVKSYLNLAIGAAPLDISPEDTRSTNLQFNMSAVKDAASEALGLSFVQKQKDEAMENFLDENALGNWSLNWGDGVEGLNGWEGAWSQLVDKTRTRNEVRVFKIE